MECAIEDGRGNLLLQLRGDVAHRFEEAIEVKAGPGRGEDHGREIEKEQVLLHPLPEFHERGHEPGFVPVPRLVFAARHLLLPRGAHRLLDEVPFVDYHNARLFFREDFSADFLVLLGDASLGVEHEKGDVATGDRILGAPDAEEFNRIADPPLFANAGGVDQDVSLPDAVGLDFKRNVHRIARRARDGADDHALGTGEGVDQRGFADILPADDRELERVGGRGPGNGGVGAGLRTCDARLWQERDGRIHQRGNSQVVNRADGKDFVETERGEFRGVGFDVRGIHLVGGHQDWPAAPAQTRGHLAVERDNPFPRVDDQNDDGCAVDGDLNLIERRPRDHVPLQFAPHQAQSACIDERKRLSVPFSLGAHSIAGYARPIVHDGYTPADDAVEERRFSDVGPPYDGDHT